MKRQIKFRGKRTDTGEWICGYYLEFSLCDGEGRCSYIKIDGCQPIKVLPDTVGQFTGLLDKNGGEIYEGDIIRVDTYTNNGQGETYEFRDVFTVEELKGKQWYDFISEVKFNEGGFYLSEYSEGDTSLCILFGEMRHSFPMFECELIGNIHDNPELLKGGKE